MSSPCVLVLAGLDPSGGAGLLADAEAVRAMGARPLCVATALTVQTTRAARGFEAVKPALVAESMEALLEEEDVRAIKIGMVGNRAVAMEIAALLQARPRLPLVVDPVLAASSGARLFEGSSSDARDVYLRLAQGAVLTPNAAEAEALLGAKLEDPLLAAALLGEGAGAVLLKGGHLPGHPTDFLFQRDGEERFSAPRIAAVARGTGCRLASGIAAGLARGLSVRDAVVAARQLVRDYLQAHVSV
ncbi:MAG TPA: hydroxymethylpyrimidine/phosphomethylpyrimidine kinase [Myxococcales bacterium]